MSIISSLNNLYRDSVRWANNNFGGIINEEVSGLFGMDPDYVAWEPIINDLVLNIGEVIFKENGNEYTVYDMLNEFRTYDGWSINSVSTLKPFINLYCRVSLDNDKRLNLERIASEFSKAISKFYKLTTAEFLSVIYINYVKTNDKSVKRLEGLIPITHFRGALDKQMLASISDTYVYNLKSASMGRIPPISDEDAAGIILELKKFSEDKEDSIFKEVLLNGVQNKLIRQEVHDFLKSYSLRAYDWVMSELSGKR